MRQPVGPVPVRIRVKLVNTVVLSKQIVAVGLC